MTATMRGAFVAATEGILAREPRTALVLADISADAFVRAARRHPGRVINLGIREQLMIGVAGGLALTGLRPIVHSYASFLVDRAYEQVKLDLGHQGAGAVLVSIGASYDASSEGRTHQSPGDVALFDTLDPWAVHVPGHPDEVERLLTAAARTDDRVYVRLSAQQNASALPSDGRLMKLRAGGRALVVAVGPMLDPVLAAVEGLDVCVAATNTPRPFDVEGLHALLPETANVVLVEPYLAGTSSARVSDTLRHRPHRLLALGVRDVDLHRYGSPADHARWQGLDAAGLRASITAFLDAR